MIHLAGYIVQQLMRETVHSHIYRAVSKADKRPVVIKVARESSAEAHAAAQQEFEIIRKLDGLPVVRAIELDYVEDHPALVMELFAGIGIDDWLAAHPGPIGLDAFLTVGIAITRALAAIHDRGVLHRDLKPPNILIDPETLEICVADFGVAASLDGALSILAAAMIGSLSYLSPEQTGRMNRRVDNRSDLYSLGATFYEMVAGKLPFVLSNPLELVHAHFALNPEPPSAHEPSVPAVVSDLVLKLLAKGPEDRYQSAQGVEADLAAIAAQRAAGEPLGGFALGRQDRARTFLLPSRLYGRHAELALLGRCLAVAQDGAVELLAVAGASGSGKTALFAEAEQRLALQRGHVIKGKFDRLARNVPFSAINQALTGLVEQLLAKTDRELDELRADLLRTLAGLGQVILEIAPAVDKLIGPQPALPAVGLAESQARISDVFWRFISAFAIPERPLVIVLDDLQWADSGSLILLDGLLEAGRRSRRKVALLVLVAYRENELAAAHPFRELLDRESASVNVHRLSLAALEVGHLEELLIDTLRIPRAGVTALAETVFRKTRGNAFFVHQFLRHVHRLGLFRFVAGDGWQWDLEAIQTAGVPDDAAGLMVEKIRSLTATVQDVVVDASIIGDELDRSTLLAVTRATGEQALHAIHVLIEDGLLVRAGARYRFAHDKIREAALGLCSDDHASRVHVEVGRHRLRALDAGTAGAQLFAITDHLNHGHHHLAPAERSKVAALNLQCGKQALAVGAVSTAEPYLAAGLRLLDGDDPWHSHFQLMFELTLEHAHVQFFNGHDEPALAAFYSLLDRKLSLPNLAAVHLRLITARITRESYEQATREGLAGLAAFGMRIPLKPRRAHRILALIRAVMKIGSQPEKLLALPTSTDEISRARNELVNAVAVPAYFYDATLAGLLTLHAAPRMVDDGLDASAPLQLMSYAMILRVVLNKPALARRFTAVASELHERLGSPRDTPDMMFRRYQVLDPWHVPYRDSLEPFRIAIEKALDVGDHRNVVFCHVCRMYCALIEGIHLARVERMGQEAYDGCVRIGLSSEVEVINSLREIANQLREQPVLEIPDDWFETIQLRRLVRRLITFHVVATAQILVLLLRGDLDAAYELADRITPAVFLEARGVVFVWIACVGLGVGAAIRLRKARGAARRRYRKQLDTSIAKLRAWAIHNPAFFGHKAQWLEAERARAHGRNDEALVGYLAAHEAALAAEYPHIAAAIDLRRGELALEMGHPSEASARFHAALQAYRAWGAKAVVTHLEQRYADHVRAPQALLTATAATTPGDSRRTTEISSPDQLDFGGLVGASHAIAQEVTLASVLERVMSNTMAIAGATFGALLLEQHGALTVEIRQHAGDRLERCASPLEDSDDLPHSIVHYVHHGGEAVVLEDAATTGAFVADQWVRNHDAKSILCAPIVKQARRVGVLFLHNALVSNAFTGRHLTTLQMLATQAAISIDNAILYDELSTLNHELEARVDDRTRALREAQHQLIESARKAGMADVAVEVLHNVGNALTSVNISTQLIQTQIVDSKVKTLMRVVAMLEDHKHDLGEFLTNDARGMKVTAMLAAIGVTLTGEHDTMLQELVRLRDNVDHVAAIVQELEATAEDKGIALLEAPQLLLGEAVATITERCAQAAIAVATELHDLAGTKVDRHKGLAILIGVLGNAVDALEHTDVTARQIRIRVRGEPTSVVFEITDNGVGIADENLTRIFHGDFSTKHDRRGASLHRFANLASSVGGSLTAHSDGLGRGASFTLTLPNRAIARSQTVRLPRPSTAPAPVRRRRVS